MHIACRILPATPADAPAFAAIYAHYVVHGTESFEIVPPGSDEIADRMKQVRDQGGVWLAARANGGDVLRYAYAAQFHERTAYRYACEDSIYLRHDCLGCGIGTALLVELIATSEAAGFRQMVAVISARAGQEPASIALHVKCGFRHGGRLSAMGRKHGQWLDTIYMQRALGRGADMPPVREPE